MTLAQIVALSALPDLAAHSDAARRRRGAVPRRRRRPADRRRLDVSMTGNNVGQVLSGSRMLFALAEHGDLPAFFGRVHPRYRTPANAILFTSAVALALALSGSFAKLAVVSALTAAADVRRRSAATLRLRSPRFDRVASVARECQPPSSRRWVR